MISVAHFRLRAIEGHERAKAATDSGVAAIHEWLAQKYDKLAEEAETDAATPNRLLLFSGVLEAEPGRDDFLG